jgi:hypothetical protein
LKITYQLSSNYNTQETLQTCVDILSRRFAKAGIGRHVEISVREDLRRVHPEIIEPWHYSDQAKKGTVAGRMNTMSTTARPTPTTAAPTTTARVDLFEPESEEDKIEAPAEVMNPDTHLATPTAGDNKRVANSSTSTTAANETAKGALPDLATPTAGNNERVANSSTSTTAANETKGSPTLVPLLLPPTKPPRVHFLISRLRRLATMKGSPTLAPLLLPPTKLPRVHSLISDHGPTTGSKYEAARATRSPYRPPRGL